jgi:DNA polymerase III subunit delta'
MEKQDWDKNGWPLCGNRPIVGFLEKSLSSSQIAGAYIFSGPRDLGKTATAIFFAKSLLCQNSKNGGSPLACGRCASCRQMQNDSSADDGLRMMHGDFHLLCRETDKKNISVEQVREFIRIMEMSSFMNSYKIGIIKDANELSEGAANALLKTLEEPREKVAIILTVSHLDNIPATIASRCQILNFLPVPFSDIYDYLVNRLDCPRSEAKNIARLSLGRPALAAKFWEDKEFYQSYKEKAELFLSFFKDDINERLRAAESAVGSKEEDDKTESAANIIGIWQGVARDLLSLYTNNGDLIQHEIWREELGQISSRLGGQRLLAISKSLESGKDYLSANVNPRLVLENIAVSI